MFLNGNSEKVIRAFDKLQSDQEKEQFLRKYLEVSSRSAKEIEIVFTHFRNDWLLSAIIAPSEQAMENNDHDLITKSMDALRVFDDIVLREKILNPEFREALIENFLAKGKQDGNITFIDIMKRIW